MQALAEGDEQPDVIKSKRSEVREGGIRTAGSSGQGYYIESLN